MKKAFTLSEVLITLAIIGVVAALTIPSVVNNYKKQQFRTGLKKEYSVLLQALDMYKEANGEPLKKENCTLKLGAFKDIIKPYLKILVDCGNNQAAGFNGKCVANGDYTGKYTYKTYSGINARETFFDDGQLILNDGSHLLFENSNSVTFNGTVYVSVDINGYNKLPNKWGEDVFTFQLMDDGRLLPMGAEDTDYTDQNIYCSKTSTNSFNGIGCTQRALSDENFWK